MGACPGHEILRRLAVWLACLALHLSVIVPEAKGSGPFADRIAGNTIGDEWVRSPEPGLRLHEGFGPYGDGNIGNVSGDAWVWSSRRLAIMCYPADCYAVEGDDMYVCAQQDFCAVYRETKERESTFWTEMDKDTEMATEKMALHWGGRIAGFIGVALGIGAVFGILLSVCTSLGAARGNRCCQRAQLMKWTRYRQAKVAVALFILLVFMADAVGAYLLVKSGAAVGEDVNEGLFASGVTQLLHGFMGSLPALSNPMDKHYWTLMLDNPTQWNIVIDKLSGSTWLQDMPTTKILMLNAPEVLASHSSASVNMSAGVHLGTALIAVAKTASTLLGEGTLTVRLDLRVQGKFNDVEFGFGCDFRLPLDTTVLDFPSLPDIVNNGIEDAVLYNSLHSGLQMAHERGEVIMQVESLKLEGEFVDRAILFGLLICGTIALPAWCGSFICCSALLRDRQQRASVTEEAAERVEQMKKIALQEKAAEASAHAASNQQPQFACNAAVPQQYGMVQPVYQYQPAQAAYMSADMMQVHIQMDGDLTMGRDKE